MAIRRRAPTSEPAPLVGLRSVALSRLLPEALSGIRNREARFTVLDFGAGSKGTVEYFATLDCPTRLIFLDSEDLQGVLRDHEEKLRKIGGGAPSFIDIVNLCRRYFSLEADLQIDLLLLWDFLHMFDLQSVEAISNVLQPHVHRGTRGYGFGSLHSDQPMPCNRYTLGDGGQVGIEPLGPGQSMPHAHSQQVLAEFFVCMRISRATLLQKGHLELLFEA